MEFIDPELLAYCESHTSEEDPLLKKIVRETQAKVLMPRMISGHLQGKILELFVKMLRPKTILEIGTYTGYSGICMARGLAEGGKLITLDINDELETMVRGFFEESGLASQIDYRLGNALDIIPSLEGPFDLVFIDADKFNYSNYYDLVIDKMPSGGIILADNVLWSGKVLPEGRKKLDKDTEAILEFNRKVHQDSRVENSILPIRDGILMARKL
ncbi:MAG TPA: methyltransferase [Algoriphagus sp.]|jgi:predicted O-methyltransferase YrrM|uniref:O-methyltransferase n=2 Tax=Algoriphagus TaxID=246875 RepID=UPI000C4A7F38|nr:MULTISPECIES: O-methyltransferase [unclassified Algoriphagus]MAL15062.1 methyltransferase [Algoriphagus sp.]MAN87827.1 methyltransferase [Algoriphagus sp.]HAD53468.1 methyltransferase [Algoriphagus sp.]HCB47665.1 methyltransferase [Algoriphagus sp.]HCD89599.1 methyltransferase [Algoriphagus sp.]|tara:strand:+ start:4698 stop:5342 length:645 start_codon:yes stop_codon:yes gene_type:complete